MFYILLSFIVLLPVIAGIGGISEKFFGRFISGISSKLLFGILTISVTWTICAFFFPLNLNVEILTISVGILSFFLLRIHLDFWEFFKNQKPVFYVILITIVFFGSFFPFILDHFGYYIPTIKWISEFGLVKGISNLDLLLGQMSVWHIFQAGFSHFSDPFLRINSIALIIYLIYIFEKKSWVHLIFLPVLFLFSQSPSPDLPVISFSLIILNEIYTENGSLQKLFAFSIFIFSIKPTMIWLPIFVFLYGVLISKSHPKFIISGSLILLLFLAKNIYCFGYPIFPVQLGNLGISWKPNPELLNISSQTAVEKTFDLQYKYAEIQKFSILEYINNWLFLKGIKSKIHLLFILILLVFAGYAFIRKQKIISLLFISVVMKSILVLIFSAQYRFFIDVFFVLIFLIFYHNFSKKLALVSFTVFSIFFGIFLSFPNLVKKHLPSFKLGHYITGFQKSQLLEPAYFEWHKFDTHQIGNLKFNVVKNYPFSFDVALPAISPEFIKEDYDAGIFPQQNSENVKDGFYWKRLSPKEREQLKEILSKINPKIFK